MSPWYPFKLDWLNQSSLGLGVENGVNDKMKTHLEVLDLLFPKARAEILRLLFSKPKAQHYVRELMLMSGLALRTVQEELAILTTIGLVTSSVHGSRFIPSTSHFSSITSHLSRRLAPSPPPRPLDRHQDNHRKINPAAPRNLVDRQSQS
jgi:hypothetical protein